MSQQLHPHYRPDIDGLRAVAILLVVVFHAFPMALPGGFIGVDIFFVISGYLISTIIFKNIDAGRFSYRDFYARRIRRIFPALMAVFLVALPAAWFLFFPDEFVRLGRQVFKSNLFTLNLNLAHSDGYFAVDSNLKPFLHLWSLCIEEQFYLIWPLVMAVSWRYLRRFVPLLILGIILASFIANIVIGHKNELHAFYWPVARFWELAMGSFLAYLALYRNGLLAEMSRLCRLPALSKAIAHEFAAFLGLTLIVIGAVCYQKDILFPGWWVLLPVLGAFLSIAAGAQARFNRLVLANRPAIFIGLISYPLYLWHWPLLSFGRILNSGGTISNLQTVILVAAAFALATFTYAVIEKKIRFSPYKYTVHALVLCSVIIAVFALIISRGMIEPRIRTNKNEIIFSAFNDWSFPNTYNFSKSTKFKYLVLKGDTEESMLIAGDSHAEQIWPRVKRDLDNHPIPKPTVVFATYGGCPPLPGINRIRTGYACDKFFTAVQELADDPKVKTVVFTAAWEGSFGLRFQTKRPNNLDVMKEVAANTGIYRVADPDHHPIYYGSDDSEIVLNNFEKEIAHLRRHGKKVYLILSTPNGADYDPRNMVSRFRGEIASRDVDRRVFVAYIAPLMDRLKDIARRTGAIAIDPVPTMCETDICPTREQDGRPVFKDADHARPYFMEEKGGFVDEILN